jgi:serine phosphatase RsbU (regulator of sigma subunit)
MSPALAAAQPWMPMLQAFQNTLVPAITHRSRGLEVYGRSIPKDEVGGDLVDLVADSGDVIAYVADVSGHGLRAGVLMGMIKTAMRYGLRLGQPLVKLLADLNGVLPAVKEPEMFATLAALRFDGRGEAEYCSAGHVPLLQYRHRHQDVVRHAMSHFPLGLFAGAAYTNQPIRYEAGDVFVLVTDGVVDPDMDEGLDRLAQTIRTLGGRPLSQIAAAIRAEFSDDDQSVLLVRIVDDLADREAAWRRLLDELAEELTREQ